MNRECVSQLGYIGIEVSDLGAWKEFAGDCLGLELSDCDAEDLALLRLDDNHHRIALQRGVRDDLAHVGWEAQDEAALGAIADRLQSLGYAVAWGSEEQARQRCVVRLITTSDPDGNATEIFYGPLVRTERPFRSPRAIGGFVAGALGLGHIVLSVNDREASIRFYRDGLGLRISDFIELDMGDNATTTAAFLHSGPRHHSIAFVEVSAPKRLHHVMFELCRLQDVGSTYDLCLDRGIAITSGLGCHTNDRMVSFYMETPSGFQVEYGHGGRLIDDADWEVQLHRAPSIWGHRPLAS